MFNLMLMLKPKIVNGIIQMIERKTKHSPPIVFNGNPRFSPSLYSIYVWGSFHTHIRLSSFNVVNQLLGTSSN